MKLQLVLNTSYGGFSIDKEMAEWLSSKRNWIILQESDYDYKKSYPLNYLYQLGRSYYVSPNKTKIEFRSHPDLIDCVKELKAEAEKLSYSEKRRLHINTLSIVDVEINLYIEDYNDGYERIVVERLIDD